MRNLRPAGCAARPCLHPALVLALCLFPGCDRGGEGRQAAPAPDPGREERALEALAVADTLPLPGKIVALERVIDTWLGTRASGTAFERLCFHLVASLGQLEKGFAAADRFERAFPADGRVIEAWRNLARATDPPPGGTDSRPVPDGFLARVLARWDKGLADAAGVRARLAPDEQVLWLDQEADLRIRQSRFADAAATCEAMAALATKKGTRFRALVLSGSIRADRLDDPAGALERFTEALRHAEPGDAAGQTDLAARMAALRARTR